jgi:hypothetical protein
MKLIMTLLVRNEEDIVRENILYHLNRGVDKLIVTDNNSEDGTLDILYEFEKQGVIDLIHEKEDNYTQSKWVTRMAAIAMEKYNADWLIHSDADEFWWPAEGDLKDVLATVPPEFKVIVVPRNDFIPRPEPDGALFERMIIKNLKSLNHIGMPLPPKVCHRAIPGVIVAQGNHKLIHPPDLQAFNTPLLEIMHFPMRSYRQFESKIAFGGAALERNDELPKTTQRGWRNLYDDFKNGTLPEYYYSKTLSPEDVAQAFAEGRFCRDTRLRDFLKQRSIIH